MNEQETLESLEQRLHRLENAVASLQDTRALEERVVERVRQRGQANSFAVPDKLDDKLVDIKRHPLPVARETAAAANNLNSSTPDRSTPLNLNRQRWLLLEVWAEFVAMIRMFLDVRYHVGWFARLAVLVLVPVILTSHLWLLLPVPSFLGLSLIADKIVDLLLAFLLYKILSREARRYREWKAQLRR